MNDSLLSAFPNIPVINVNLNNVDFLYNILQQYTDGCEIRFGPGDFYIDRTIIFSSNTIIKGVSPKDTRIILKPNSNCHIFTNHRITKSQLFEISNLTIIGNGSEQSKPNNIKSITYACGLYFKNFSSIIIKNMVFNDIAQTALQFNQCSNIVIRDVEFYSMGWSAIGTSSADNFFADGIYVDGAGCESVHSGIHFDGGKANFFSGTVINCSGNGVMLDSTYAELSHCEINCNVFNCFRGVSLSGKSTHPLRCVYITGEMHDCEEAGVMVSNSNNVILAQCNIINNIKYGLLLQGRIGGQDVIITRSVFVKNNGINFASLHSSTQNISFSTDVVHCSLF